MNRRDVYGISVRGASHVRGGTECQDSCRTRELDNGITAAAAADGHGSSACPYSALGAAMAAEVFCDIMEELTKSFGQDLDALRAYLSREGSIKISEKIEQEWEYRVLSEHVRSRRQPLASRMRVIDTAEIYKLYGTTLLGILMAPEYIFVFQIGDGDIMLVTEEGAQSVVDPEKFLGVETHSLSREGAWKKAVTAVCSTEEGTSRERLYMLSTDGFLNSHRDHDEFLKTCRSYLEMIREYGFEDVSANLEPWLKETSEKGCGDDITVILAYELSDARPAGTRLRLQEKKHFRMDRRFKRRHRIPGARMHVYGKKRRLLRSRLRRKRW